MQYNLNNPLDKERFNTRVRTLMAKGSVIELTEKAFRTPNQNRYLHLLIGVVAMETGNTIEDAKLWYFKRICNPDLFFIKKADRLGNTLEAVRSSADLTQEEMSMAIDRFKKWGAENGIYMPNPGDEQLLRDIEISMGAQRLYLGA